MKTRNRFLMLCILLTAIGCSREAMDTSTSVQTRVMPDTPWTGKPFDDAPGKFMFALFSDLTGGEREGVFNVAVSQLSHLRPEFIVNVGDLIDGKTQIPDSLNVEWDSFDERAARASAPVFYTGGNHDLTGPVLRDVWQDRNGRLYYHFLYKNALFLVLDTEDHTPDRMEEIMEARNAAVAVEATDPDRAASMEYFTMPERASGQIGPEQGEYFVRVINENPDVRWTFLLMHKPVWQTGEDPEFESIIGAIGDADYTVFNGHLHSYSYTEKNGADHIMLGTTAGGQGANNPMSFDHVTLVTVDEGKPSIANLRLDGILNKSGGINLGGDSLCFQRSSVLCN